MHSSTDAGHVCCGFHGWKITNASIDDQVCVCIRTDHVTNAAVLEQVRKPQLFHVVMAKQVGWMGHGLRSAKRKRGRPRLLYHRNIDRITGLGDPQAVRDDAQDRGGWRIRVIDCSFHAQPP